MRVGDGRKRHHPALALGGAHTGVRFDVSGKCIGLHRWDEIRAVRNTWHATHVAEVQKYGPTVDRVPVLRRNVYFEEVLQTPSIRCEETAHIDRDFGR